MLKIQCWNLHVESWMLKVGCSMLKVESWMLKVECWKLNVKSWKTECRRFKAKNIMSINWVYINRWLNLDDEMSIKAQS
jgi:hypothetical protein